jgi:hypothetical protein
MAPSVRVKRRHAYASIRDEDRHASERLLEDPEPARRALSEGAGALSPVLLQNRCHFQWSLSLRLLPVIPAASLLAMSLTGGNEPGQQICPE